MSSILTLILMLLLGSGLAYLALENSTPVDLTLLGATFPNIPLFIIIAGCILAGLLLALVLNISTTFSTVLSLHHKDKIIKDLTARIAALQTKAPAPSVAPPKRGKVASQETL